MTDKQYEVNLEPVAWMYDIVFEHPEREIVPDWMTTNLSEARQGGVNIRPLYTAPPQRKEEPQPVAWIEQQFYDDGTPNPCALLKWAGRNAEDDFPIGTKLYTAPPQRVWQWPEPSLWLAIAHDGRVKYTTDRDRAAAWKASKDYRLVRDYCVVPSGEVSP